ncbi:PTS sugar transporter subunit IIB [Metabacillus sp. YM-086]|uniref:PTS sugar transporter subunit IIB n=1 Tax=Metabacillus TaxID=2675233 RepID=UPI000EF5DA6D|nr:PTS sugar transporter subunit IIB [Metabacillus litoralis]MCM3411726.1 PTS sugar transporter subunit IIB [Metabacillus litoralis]
MKISTILVACGAGIATSTIVAQRVESLLKENKIRAELIQCTISEVGSLQSNADLIISTTLLPKVYETPTIVATSYITGVGMEKIDQQILDLLKK